MGREPPSAETDSRNFSEAQELARPPALSLLHLPPIGTVLPFTPLTPIEMQSALALPEAESRRALLRCLDFFGARRLETGGQDQAGGQTLLEIPCGVREGAPRELICTANVTYAQVLFVRSPTTGDYA